MKVSLLFSVSVERLKFLEECCEIHMDNLIEEHIQKEMCCACCETAFTNKGGVGPIGRQCYSGKCNCWDSDKACQTCRKGCANIQEKYLPKPKRGRKPRLVKDQSQAVADTSSLISTPPQHPTPTPLPTAKPVIPHLTTKQPKGPWWKTSGCCPCSEFCKKGCPCHEGKVY